MGKRTCRLRPCTGILVSLLKDFVERGQDINVQDNEGSTALHSAVINQQPESVRELLALGIDTSIKTREPNDADEEPAQTALEIAEVMGPGGTPDEQMVEILRAVAPG